MKGALSFVLADFYVFLYFYGYFFKKLLTIVLKLCIYNIYS